MRSYMSAHYYLEQEIFAREQHKLFRKVWLFAGLRTLLPEHNSFITRQIAGIPVLIQNLNGQLRAFENACLHRGAKLHTDPVGKRPLVCPYHAWRYGPDGEVLNIPDCDAVYGFSPEQRSALKLREFALESVGNVLFVNLDDSPLPLEAQFSSNFLQSLADSSSYYDTEVMVTTWRGQYNWKLAYENLRDANHPRFVHPQTLAKTVDFKPLVNHAQWARACAPMETTSASVMHDEMRGFSFGGADAPLPSLQPMGWHENVERWGHDDVYYNWLAYPNLHVASANGGLSFTIEHHIPVSPDTTDLEIYWFTARKKRPYPSSHQVLLAHMHGSKCIVGEDVDVMERVQAALHPDAPVGTQGKYESMNRLVERWYQALMESDCEL